MSIFTISVLTLSLSSNRMVLGAWISFDAVASTSISQASIASDGTNLLVFYRYPNVSLNIDEGIIKKWNGSSWVTLHYCHISMP
jgi:hypothetical protein